MDLKKFKKVNADSQYTTFEHPDGHVIKVKHKATEKHVHQEIRRLAIHPSGGHAQAAEAHKYAQGGPVLDPEKVKQFQQGFGGGAPKAYAEGGDVTASTSAPTEDKGIMGRVGDMAHSAIEALRPVLGGVDNGGVGSTPASPSPELQQSMPPGGKSAAPALSSPQLPQAPVQSQGQAGDPYGFKAHDSNFQQGFNQQNAGITAQAAAESDLGNKEASELGHQAEQQQKAADDYKAQYANLEKDRQAAMNDYQSGHIDPNHYFHDKSTGSKISTVLGLLIGGLGGPDNQASRFLNDQIDRDIAAQKENLGRKKSILDYNMQRFGNLDQATKMTSIMMKDAMATRLNSMAAQSKDPMAKARAQQLIGAHQQDAANTLGQIAQHQTMAKMGDNVNPVQAINMRITDPSERKEAQKQLEVATKTHGVHEAIDRITKEIGEQQTVSNRLMNPLQSRQLIAAKTAELIPLIMESSPSKRLTHESLQAEIAPMIQGFTTNKNSADAMRAGLHRLADTHADSPTMLDGYGIKYPKYTAPTTKSFSNSIHKAK